MTKQKTPERDFSGAYVNKAGVYNYFTAKPV